MEQQKRWHMVKQWIFEHKLLIILFLETIFILCWLCVSSKQSFVHLEYENERIWEVIQDRITLPQGIYEVMVSYEETEQCEGGWIRAYARINDEREIWCDEVAFQPTSESIHFPIWVNSSDADDISFSLDDYGGNINIQKITIETAWNSMLYRTICLILKWVVLDLLLFGFWYREALRKHSVVIAGILGITCMTSLLLFTRYLVMGHDAMFHMDRIEGLKDGLLTGNFPVRIQPTWNYGWGYGVSLMYGDLTLFFPALMRICGFTITTSWKAFHVLINFGTAAISYYAFYKISRKRNLSLLMTLLYCTASYRLACLYIRSAVGEAAVMMFLPLVVLFFWYAFGEEEQEKEYGTKLIAPVIGFTGMIQTHILTCEMAALFMVILCVIEWRRLFRKKTLLYFGKVALYTILVNLWFLVPFLQMFGEDLVIMQMEEMRNDFQIWGLSITELFATSPARAYYFTFGENTSLANKCTLTIGTALWGAVFATILLIWNKKLKNAKPAAVCIGFGILAAAMTTNLFPYTFLKKHVPMLSTIFGKLQFSYRFLGMATLFFVLAIFFAECNLHKNKKMKKYMLLFSIVIGVLAGYQGMDYQYQLLYGGTFNQNKYAEVSLDSAAVITGEYLYQGTDIELTKTEQSVITNEVNVERMERNGLRTQILCKAVGVGAYLETPQFYYPGYVAKDLTGTYYPVTRSEHNNRIRVELPNDFDGVIEIFYREPVIYRICEVISLLSALILIFGKRFKAYGVNKWNWQYRE